MADDVGQALAGLVPRVGRDDWDDVLRRSEERRPRRAVLVLAVVGCLLVAIPAVAAPKLWRSLSAAKAPSAELWATLRLPDGRPAGTLELALPGALWSNPRSHLRLPRRLVRTAHGVRLVNTFVVRWRLEVTALGGRADRGVLYIRRNVAHAGTEVATL